MNGQEQLVGAVLRGLRWEREEKLENLIEQDEHPEYLIEDDETTEKGKLKRELKEEAMRRLEEAARTVENFQNVVSQWDRLDSNRERKERYHEVKRGDVPIETGMSSLRLIFPETMNNEYMRMLLKGYFLDAIFDCPFEIDELVADEYVSQALKNLKPEHKEVMHFLIVRKFKTAQLACVRGQTDRNIRKVYHTALWKVRKHLIRCGRIKEDYDFDQHI